MARRVGVDDKGAVQALVDVPLQRDGVAVIEMAAEGLGLELVDELATGQHVARARHAVHARGVDAVEVYGVRMRAAVAEADAHPLALGNPDGRTGNAAVVGPGREDDARRDLDVLVDGLDHELATGAP